MFRFSVFFPFNSSVFSVISFLLSDPLITNFHSRIVTKHTFFVVGFSRPTKKNKKHQHTKPQITLKLRSVFFCWCCCFVLFYFRCFWFLLLLLFNLYRFCVCVLPLLLLRFSSSFVYYSRLIIFEDFGICVLEQRWICVCVKRSDLMKQTIFQTRKRLGKWEISVVKSMGVCVCFWLLLCVHITKYLTCCFCIYTHIEGPREFFFRCRSRFSFMTVYYQSH